MRKVYNGPALIDIALTNRCNLKCDFCYASAGVNSSAKGEISVSDYDKLFKVFSNMNVLRISLSGGEPFSRRDFFEILERAGKYNFGIIINSMGQ
ncbi:radical SAM protein [Terrilactibacillus laevilacticus]|uniref:radical SAM protein n=1 Tax=Terrilactibacillus laevilacticus TaxID=1380157 RepID=UPI001FE40036|nr:radical SAM protein [Terrilactibacillus laevilacticus]